MITIPVKIKREDKVIMIKLLDSVADLPFDITNINSVIAYEHFIEILSKLRASQHNDRPIRLNLAQANGFWFFISNTYSDIGDYELANGNILAEKIRQDMAKKILTLKQ